ncbi:hypothetical protein [Agarivorans sp. QJM3NY_25]|uniref:hypothetical protein n=1 Tax=Agarivorans sp. QJM3NY_25 TaxID=3421430 RepID=UPI003D7EADD5
MEEHSYTSRPTLNHNEHLFIFLSIMYAYLVSIILKEITVIIVETSFLNSTPFQRYELILVLSCWCITFLFSVQTWWSLWFDKKKANKSFNHFILLNSLPALFLLAVAFLNKQTDVWLESYNLGPDSSSDGSTFLKGLHNYLWVMGYILLHIVLMKYKLNENIDSKLKYLHQRALPGFLLIVLGTIEFYLDSNGKNYSLLSGYLGAATLLACGVGGYLVFVFTNRYKNLMNREIDEDEFVEKCLPLANDSHRNKSKVAILIVKSSKRFVSADCAEIKRISRKDQPTHILPGYFIYHFIRKADNAHQIKGIMSRVDSSIKHTSILGITTHQFVFYDLGPEKDLDCEKQMLQFLKEARELFDRKLNLEAKNESDFPYIENCLPSERDLQIV